MEPDAKQRATEFAYELSKFIPFRDAAACERVRSIKKRDIVRHPMLWGICWCGHVAFWEAHLGFEFGDELAAYKVIGSGFRPKQIQSAPATFLGQGTAASGWTDAWVAA